MVRFLDAVLEILEEQGDDCDGSSGACDYFGVSAIQNFRYDVTAPVIITYGGQGEYVLYLGFEIVLTLRIF